MKQQKLNGRKIVAMMRTKGSLMGYDVHNPYVVILDDHVEKVGASFIVAQWDGKAKSWQSGDYNIGTIEEAMTVAASRGGWS
jgi:hypothetical protein